MYKRLTAAQKFELIKKVRLGVPVARVCQEAQISRTIFYRWLRKYKEAGPRAKGKALITRVASGKAHWRRIPGQMERRILKTALLNPVYSPKRLSEISGLSSHGVWSVLRRYGLATREARLNHIYRYGASLVKPRAASHKMTMIRRFEAGEKVAELCREFRVSRTIFYRWLRKYKEADIQQKGEALANVRPSGQNHWRFVPEAREAVIAVIRERPELSSHKIAQEIASREGKRVLGSHGVYNLLLREDLNTLDKRLRFAQGYIEEPKVSVAPAYVPQIPIYRLRWILSPFTTVPRLLLTKPLSGILVTLAFALPLFLIFLLLRSLVSASAQYSPTGLIFASIALFFGLFFLLYSLKYYISALLVLRLAQGGSRDRELERREEMEDERSKFSKFLAKVFKLTGFARAPELRTSHLNMNLDQVKLDQSNRPFVSIHVAVFNEKRVVERLIQACTRQEWYAESSKFKVQNSKLEVANYDPSASSGSPAAVLPASGPAAHSTSSGPAAYELIIADDSTDETTEIAKQTLIANGWKVSGSVGQQVGGSVSQLVSESVGQAEQEIFVFRKADGPTVKLIHRFSRSGFKGGALQRALEETDPRASYITVFDADFVPYPDTIEQFVKTFQVLAADSSQQTADSQAISSKPKAVSQVAAVQGYQWHVLNKSENWVTRGVRTEYAGSYVIERSGEEIYGGLKQIAGSVYMIRADILRAFGWGTSITEDFELTLRLYESGYKVAFTPYIQAPAEAVSTLKRLIRQRMRWAEGASFNVKVMLGRMLWGRWQIADSLQQTAVSSEQSAVSEARVWIPSRLSRAEKLEFAYLAPYYLQAAFFVVGTLSWFISETIFNTRLPFWTAALGWSLVFTNLLSLPLMNIIGMFLEESDERDYIGILSFIALSYIVVPFQAYAAIKGFLESSEGPWFRTPKTGLITDTLGRRGFGKFFGNILGKTAPTLNSTDYGALALDYSAISEWSVVDDIRESNPYKFTLPFNSLLGGGMPALAPIRALRPLRRVSRRLVSRSFMAIVVIFTMVINYMAIMGSNLAKLPSQEDVAAEESGPTKLGESNLASARPKDFVPVIEKIEVEKSVNLSSEIDFQYQAYLDDDNLAMFGRRYANDNANENCANSCESRGVVRIVYAGGKYMQMEIPDIIGGPTAMSSTISFEQEAGLIDFKIQASRLAWEYTYFEKPTTNHLTIDLLTSKDLVPRHANNKGWQIVDETVGKTVFFTQNPEVKDLNGVKGKADLEIRPRGGDYVLDLAVDENLLTSGAYPVVVDLAIETNPPYPVFDIADARENEASDYNYAVTVPGNRNKVGFNSKSGNSVGYRIDTGDNLYSMEMAMKERSAAPTSVEGGKVSYDLGNMEAIYEVWNDRVKADYVLKSKPAGNTIDFTFNNFSQIPTKNINCGSTSEESKPTSEVFGENVRCVGPEEAEKAGSISLWGDDGYGNINGREVFRLDIPSIRDGNGVEIPKDKASLSFSKEPPLGCVPGDSSTSPRGCFGLVPGKLVPKYCAAEDKDCQEPPGYYDRSGIITLTIDQSLLESAAYPLTIDPTSIDTAVASTATAYGSQRHLLRTSDNDLVIFYVDSDSDIESYYSNNNGQTWSNLANVYVGTVDDFGAAIDSSNNVSISFSESTDVKYLQITNMITSNDIDGTWTVSSAVSLDTGTTPLRPSIAIDVNVFPAVAWAFETSGGTKNSAIRFSRAVATPTTSTNWECATASSCGYVKNTNCSTDVCGDHIQPETGKNTVSHSVIVKAPSTATNADELVIMSAWENSTTLYSSTATVNGANYNAWSTPTSRDATGVTTTDFMLSSIAVDDGTNQRVWTEYFRSGPSNCGGPSTCDDFGYLNADDNSWTDGSLMYGNVPNTQMSVAYNGTDNKIMFFAKTAGGSSVRFRWYDIASDTKGGAAQVIDRAIVGEELWSINVKEDNAPTTSPGPKMDLVYINNDNAMTPTYSVFYHTWHTKETRNYDNPAALPTTETVAITSGDNNLSFFYTESEYTDSNSDNAVYVPASTSTITDFAVQTFKKTHTNSSDEIQISWNGKKATEACGASAAACTLQIYQWGNSGCSAGWGDFDSGTRTDTTTGAGTEFTLTGNRTSSLSCYYSSSTDADDHLGTNTVAVRVQTDCSSNCNLQTDVITFTFVPEKVLLLLPLALFMPRIMRRFGWNVRFRKRFKFMEVRRR